MQKTRAQNIEILPNGAHFGQNEFPMNFLIITISAEEKDPDLMIRCIDYILPSTLAFYILQGDPRELIKTMLLSHGLESNL